MKLSKCTHGTIVIMKDGTYGDEIGMIIGLTYNVSQRLAAGMTGEELCERTIPLVQFPDRTAPVNHCNLELYKG